MSSSSAQKKPLIGAQYSNLPKKISVSVSLSKFQGCLVIDKLKESMSQWTKEDNWVCPSSVIFCSFEIVLLFIKNNRGYISCSVSLYIMFNYKVNHSL